MSIYGEKYKIIINEDLLDNRSVLEIATTILHESVHALLYSKYRNTRESFLEIFKEYIKSKTGKYDFSHSIMRDYYITPIAKVLKQLDNSKEGIEFYEILASEGIKKTLTDKEKKKLKLAKEKVRKYGLNCN